MQMLLKHIMVQFLPVFRRRKDMKSLREVRRLMIATLQVPPEDVAMFLSLFGVWEVKERNVDVIFGKVVAIIRNQTLKCCETDTCRNRWVANRKNRTWGK